MSLGHEIIGVRSTAVAVIALGLLTVPGAALGKVFPGGEGEAPPGVTISGTGFAGVAAPDRLSEASIQRAIDAAQPRAVTRALRSARQRATAIADAAGIELGQLVKLEIEDAFAQFGLSRRHCRGPRRDRPARCRVPPVTAATATVTFSIVNGAQGSDGPEVQAYGSASAPTEPDNARSDRSIRQALDAARAAVTPRAAKAARRSVETAARSAGLTVGGVISIAEQRQPYPYFYDVTLGSFGPGQFCGIVRRTIFGRDPETGRPRPLRRVRDRRCHFPRIFDLRLQATYEAR